MKRKLLAFLLLVAGNLLAQPTDNPYRSKYLPTASNLHWTDTLKWNNIVNVSTFGAIPNDGTSDLAATRQAIDAAAAAGGGIVFFPAGTYNFEDSLLLKSGVVLRGETPTVSEARDTTYRLKSKLEFPAYVFDTTANNGAGYDVKQAFKFIAQVPNAHDIGVVNLDINRARIVFQPWEWQQGQNTRSITYYPIDTVYNVLVMGIRNNNTAISSPSVPDPVHKPWQRFSWRFAANISVFVSFNGVVNNNRLNDSTTDNFNQPGYITNTRAGVTCQPLMPDGSSTAFSYTDHYGIALNRCKLKRTGPRTNAAGTGPLSGYGVYPSIPLATPEEEPSLYATGNEVIGNWIFKTMRVGIWAAGNGLRIENNTTRDLSGKKAYLAPDGVGCLQPIGPTFEHRGIDFSGWKVRVLNNDIEVNQSFYGRYGTTDGEGILLQEVGGGTTANDIVISGNTIKGTNGLVSLFKIGDINNTTVKNNRYIGTGMHEFNFTADRNNDPNHYLNNLVIDSNYNVNKMVVEGPKGGTPSYVTNNTGTGSADFSVPCHVILNNNTGFAAPVINNLPCPTTLVPQARIVLPTTDSVITSNLPTLSVLGLKVKQFGGLLTNSKVFLYRGTTVVDTGTIISQDSTIAFTVTLPPNPGTYFYTAKLIDQSQNITVYSQTLAINLVKPVAVLPGIGVVKALGIYPNPANNLVYITGLEDREQIKVYDALGRNIPVQVTTNGIISVNGLNAGIYSVVAKSAKGPRQARLVVE